jgi:hypothetical protein
VVVIGGAPMRVRKYVIDGEKRYIVGFGSRNVALMFVVVDRAGQAVFTLAKCISCNPAILRLGVK